MTLYFKIQFLILKCTENIKNTIESALKSEGKKILSLKKKVLRARIENTSR